MKKILFVSPRNPFSGRYSGDVVRANKFINFFSRNNFVKVISPDFKNSTIRRSKLNYEGFKDTNFITKIYYVFLSLINLKPLQLGYFYSPKIHKYIKKYHEDYDLIFFQSFRTAQYKPENSVASNILDMGDITSNNYNQTSRKIFFLNPLRIIYFIESILLKKYEDFCFYSFQKTLLFSKKEINSVKKEFRKKIIQISFGVESIKRKYKFSLKNNKIVFIGNIKYSPNKHACYEFVDRILPKILKIYPNIEFHIIGEISKIDKFFLNLRTNVKIHGKVNNLEPYLNKTICGLANLKISSGIQTKLLTYMSYGIPSVCSHQVAKNFDAIEKSKINYYKNNEELIKIILKFKRNKNYSLLASKRSLKTIRNFKWDKILEVFNNF